MKKKILLLALMLAIFTVVFAVSVSAQGPKDLFSDVTTIEGITKTTTFGYGETDFSRVVLSDPETGSYTTYPAYYIFDKRDHSSEGNQPVLNLSYVNNATGRVGTAAEYKAEHIICVEFGNVFTAVSGNYTRTNIMTNLQYVKFSGNLTTVHQSAFKSLANLAVIEFEENTAQGAALNIHNYAFDNLDSLVEVHFPVQLKTLGERAFGDSSSLTTVTFAPGTDVTLYNSDGTVKNNTFYAAFIYDTALTSISLPNGLTSTGALVCGGCTSLEYVYIPASCKAFDTQAFDGCRALKEIEFAPNSQLESIGQKAITDSTVLTSLVFPNTFLTTVGEAPIRNVKGLTYINFGASFTGFSGYASMYATDNKDLIIVLSDTFNVANKDQLTANATILYTGTKAQAEAFGYTTIQSYDEWVAQGSPTGKRMVYGYNRCEAFYDGNHVLDEEKSNDCVGVCLNCGMITPKAEPKHSFTTVYAYENGFATVGTKTECCSNEGCPLKADARVSEIPAIFNGFMYATREESDSRCGMVMTYGVNIEALENYQDNTGKLVSYGVLAVAKANASDNILNADGTSSAQSIVSANVTGTPSVDLIIWGSKNAWETEMDGVAVKDIPFYIVGYASYNGAVSYFCGETSSGKLSDLTSKSYSEIKA